MRRKNVASFSEGGVGAFLVFWSLCMLLNIALWGGIIYVAIHFITKWW